MPLACDICSTIEHAVLELKLAALDCGCFSFSSFSHMARNDSSVVQTAARAVMGLAS